MTNPQVNETNVFISNSSPRNEKVYLCEYQFKGEPWSLTLHANSLEEAQHKIRSVGYGRVLGEVALEMQAGKGSHKRFYKEILKTVKKWFVP